MEMLPYNKNIMQKFPYEQNVIIKKFVTNTTRIKQTWYSHEKLNEENSLITEK